MKKHSSILFLLLAFTYGHLFSLGSMLTGEAASRLVPNSEAVIEGKFSTIPDYIRFKQGAYLAYGNFGEWLSQHYQIPSGNGFKLLATEKDKLGFVHYRLQQTVNGVPVEGTMFILHTKLGMIQSMNGQLLNNIPAPSSVSINESSALNFALQNISASKYKWEITAAENALKENTGNASATYFPKGELVYVGENNKLGAAKFFLAYKFDIYAAEPLSRNYVFVDAATGKILLTKNRIEHADAAATASTQYSGSKTITTDSYNGSYRLREAARGNGIRTYNALTSTNPGNTDFTNASTTWNNVNPAKDQYATDGHFASESTYDFYNTLFGRNSLDDNGVALVAYVHYDSNLDNAFWDGSSMNYGDGSTQYNTRPYTTLDIGGHEITHGLTQYTANLDYQDESGALNESFSDIFGVSIRQHVYQATPGAIEWRIGINNGPAFRSVSNPNAYQQPDTYAGSYWATGTADNGGVHTNSGVQNYWFYLVAHGKSGVNDNGQSYSVTGVTIEKAQAIAYRSLTNYLTNTSQYADARTYSIIAAEDLYGPCSPEVIAVTNAWYAVGVGAIFSASVNADFAPATTTSCTAPTIISFNNTSTNANTYYWDFGDGNGSFSASPTHTYFQYGTFTVSLVASSPGCGSDTVVKSQVITINNLSPVANGVSVCQGQSATLTATASGNINWYVGQNGGNPIGTGTSFNTPPLNSSTTYYAETQITSPQIGAAPANHNFGAGGYNTYPHYTIFNNTTPQVLLSVDIDAGAAGNRTIELRDASDNVLATLPVNLANGLQTVPLNFSLPAQTGLRLGIWTGTVNLYRNSSGAAYPYTSSDGTVTITGNDVPDLARFYFFYNWRIQPAPCITSRTPVVVDVISTNGTFTSTVNNTTVDFTPSVTTATTYNWTFGDGNTSTQQNPSHTYSADGTYTVELIQSNGNCSDTITQTVTINTTGIAELNSIETISLQPNPAKDFLNVLMNLAIGKQYKLSVQNVLGETLSSQSLNASAAHNSSTLDISSLASGIYFLNLQSGKSSLVKRFVKTTE